MNRAERHTEIELASRSDASSKNPPTGEGVVRRQGTYHSRPHPDTTPGLPLVGTGGPGSTQRRTATASPRPEVVRENGLLQCFNEAAGHSRRITSPPLSHVQSTGYFNEAASRGQRIPTNQIRADPLLTDPRSAPRWEIRPFPRVPYTTPAPENAVQARFSGGRPRSGRISPRSARTVGRSLPRPALATCSRGPRPDA